MKTTGSRNLVDNVGNSVARVELDLGEDGLTGSWGRDDWGWGGNNWSSCVGESWSSSIGVGWSSGIREGWSSGIGVGKSWGSDGGSEGQRSSGGWDGGDFLIRPPLAAGGLSLSLSKNLLEFSLGSCNLLGILNWSGSNKVEDGLWELSRLGNGQVGGSNTEAEVVSNVVHSLEETVGIDVAVRSGNTAVGISNLVLGRVDVGVTVVDVSKLISRVELGGSWSNWSNGCIRSIVVGVWKAIDSKWSTLKIKYVILANKESDFKQVSGLHRQSKKIYFL